MNEDKITAEIYKTVLLSGNIMHYHNQKSMIYSLAKQSKVETQFAASLLNKERKRLEIQMHHG